MPLLSFWKSAKEDVLKMSVEQIVSSAGDGNLLDNSSCCQEFRQFLSVAPIERLFDYSRHCLENSFNKSGLVLQDIVNEFGRRLDFEAENGLYQGKRNAIGYDGIWRAAGEPDLIVEVKTTDYVTVRLEKIAEYKEKLQAEGRVGKDASILIVVGREDTGALEAQVRGSRYAWEMRLISIERLIKLVQIKEKSDDVSTLNQIRQLLQPFEYTKIDKIIDVIFTTTANVESQHEIEQQAPLSENDGMDEREGGKQVRTDPDLLNAKRQQAIDAFAIFKGKELVKRSKTLYSSPDKQFRVCCAVSKRYESKKDYRPYWYAYHPSWDEFLAEGKDSYFILSCMDRDEAFAVPYAWIEANKVNMNVTDRGERSYWHVPVTTIEHGKLAINNSKVQIKTPLEPFRFGFKS
ncbi:MAG: hypothetical protein FJW36_23980 [Acidobacteria bacterium]|nr:hypothetical protein [Acidobacteriota bacterium]